MESLEIWWFKLQGLSEEVTGEPDAYCERVKHAPSARIAGEPDMHHVHTIWASHVHQT